MFLSYLEPKKTLFFNMSQETYSLAASALVTH